MPVEELKKLFQQLLASPESETLEFKAASNDFDSRTLGEYFSALSNEANLKGIRNAWLIFGVHDKTREILGTEYRNSEKSLLSVKQEVAVLTNNNSTFSNIFAFMYPDKNGKEKRVIMFEIPAAPQGMPVSFKEHFYGRNGESITGLSIQKLETIRNQRPNDWSGQIVQGATIKDLDEAAVYSARFEFKKKNPDIASEIESWDTETFLNKAKLTINGSITNAALILLGTQDSAEKLKPAISQITWILKDKDGIEVDYKHFYPPLFLNVNNVLAKIRNLTYRYMPDDSLFPTEVTQYDNYVIREALHNCIAHQDYSLQERITVVETPDTLIFSNGGSFLPETVENVIKQDAPQRYYRNSFLCTAMVNLNMIDTIGSGIKRIFVNQKNRFFPLPDYDISPREIKVKIYGKVINPIYVKLLQKHSEISLDDVIQLDKIQKNITVDETVAKDLKRRGLIEGRKGNYYLSDSVSSETDKMAEYVKNKAFNKKYYTDLTYELIKKQNKKGTTKEDVTALLYTKLSDVQTPEQKDNYIRNLLHQMVVEQKIESIKRKYYSKK
jgi:ATP-dependent DNA helicase RecG